MIITKQEYLEEHYDECVAIVNDPDRQERMMSMKEENKGQSWKLGFAVSMEAIRVRSNFVT